MLVGWIDDFKAWLIKIIGQMFDALLDVIGDSFVRGFQMITSMILYVLSKMPVPEFMQNTSIGDILSKGGGTVMWFAEIFQLGPSLVMIGIAMVFYLLRRVLTLGIW